MTEKAISEEYQSMLDGTWKEQWNKAQARPPHLIDNGPQNDACIHCICGSICTDMQEWGEHVIVADRQKEIDNA